MGVRAPSSSPGFILGSPPSVLTPPLLLHFQLLPLNPSSLLVSAACPYANGRDAEGTPGLPRCIPQLPEHGIVLLPLLLVPCLLQPEPRPFAGSELHWSGRSVHPILAVPKGTFLWELCVCLEAKKVAHVLAKHPGLMVSHRAGVASVPNRGRAVEQCVLQPDAATLGSHCRGPWVLES